jgi:hypothetical protein
MVHGDVGAAQEIGNLRVDGGRGSDSGETSNLDDPLFEHERPSAGAKHGFGHLLGPREVGGIEVQSDRELVAAKARDHRVRTKLFAQSGGDAFEQPVAGLVPVLVIDRLEALHLKRDDAEMIVLGRGCRAQVGDAVGEAFAVIEAGDRVAAGKRRGAPFLLGAHLGLVLEIDVAAPAKQDQRDVERQRSARDPHLRTEIALDPEILEKGAAVPDKQHHSGDQHRQHERVAPGIDQPGSRLRRRIWCIHTRHNRWE